MHYLINDYKRMHFIVNNVLQAPCSFLHGLKWFLKNQGLVKTYGPLRSTGLCMCLFDQLFTVFELCVQRAVYNRAVDVLW